MFKFGRNPSVHDLHTMRSALVMAEYLNPLGAPPAACNDYVAAVEKVVGSNWEMLGNDTVGDCTMADTGHALMLRTANVGKIIVPTTEQVLAAYSARTGYDPTDPSTDQGDDETGLCRWLEKVGFLGHKSDATAMIDPTNVDHLKWCTQLFGTCRLGLNLPDNIMDQFNAGKWDDASQPANPEQGHDVPIIKYEGDTFYVCTWAARIPTSLAFLKKYCTEAHVELYFDWINQQGTSPSGFNLAALSKALLHISH